MKKTIFIILIFIFASACKESENNVNDSDPSTITTISKSENDQKLIDICESIDGVAQADVKDDILTVRANISKTEAKKLGDGMLSEIKKYRQDINTVIVYDLSYKLLSYSGK